MPLQFCQRMEFRLHNCSLHIFLLTTSQLCWRTIFTLMSWLSNEPTNVGSLLFATNYWTSVLMHVWIRIFVTRLLGDLFRLFQSLPCNYQTNGMRVRTTGIVVILTKVMVIVSDGIIIHIVKSHVRSFLVSKLVSKTKPLNAPTRMVYNNPWIVYPWVPKYGRSSSLEDSVVPVVCCKSWLFLSTTSTPAALRE